MLGDDQLQHSIPEKLQPLIIEMVPLCLVAKTRVRQGFREQERISEFVTDPLFERVHGLRLYSTRERFATSALRRGSKRVVFSPLAAIRGRRRPITSAAHRFW